MSETKQPRPPRIAHQILRRLLSPYCRLPLLGDLEEEWRSLAVERGPIRAWLWYNLQALRSLPRLLHHLTYWSGTMIKNHVKIALRNLARHKGYSFINIAGLAVGMACCLLILLWVQDELSYDRFNENGADIYRVLQDIRFSDHETTWAITQGPLGPSLKADFPDIIDYARYTRRRMRLSAGEESFEEIVAMTDGSLLSMFTFPLLRGDPRTALEDPFSLVLTEEMAVKYFGGEDPLGKMIKVDDRFDFRVTGILEEIPLNSHIRFDIAVPFIFGRELNYTVDRWGNSGFTTYVQLRPGTPAQTVINKISGYLFEKPTLEKDAHLTLQPLFRIHLHSHYEFDASHGDVAYVTIFSLVAFFILIIACINFMNLTTARSANRAREVGMRKVAGAERAHLIRQFFGESLLLAIFALVIAMVLVRLLLPAFNNLAAKQITLDIFRNWTGWAALAGIVGLTGILAGAYPALFLSSFQPVRVLRGSLASGAGSAAFRRALVVFQFCLSILLIVCTTIVYGQLDFMRNKKLGYTKEYLVYMGMRGQMRDQFDAVKEELLRNPRITHVTAGSNVPTYGYSFSNSLWKWEGQKPDEELLMRATFVDLDFFETLGIEFVEGRPFSRDFPSDEQTALVVNHTAAKAMGMADPIGKRLGQGDAETRIIGVVEDYHFRSMRQEIDPLILIHSPQSCRVLFARIQSEDIPGTLSYMEDVWKKFAPGFPFRHFFMDEALDELYRSERRVGSIFRSFAALAILVSCLGLFGLASYTAERRTKEVGIRKVLGASVSGIVLLLSKEFTRWVLFANLIAWPAAWFAMKKWLQGFAYHAEPSPWAFLAASGLALAVALLTVSFQAVRAAGADPIDSLRYE